MDVLSVDYIFSEFTLLWTNKKKLLIFKPFKVTKHKICFYRFINLQWQSEWMNSFIDWGIEALAFFCWVNLGLLHKDIMVLCVAFGTVYYFDIVIDAENVNKNKIMFDKKAWSGTRYHPVLLGDIQK